jgi:hypothetical protein
MVGVTAARNGRGQTRRPSPQRQQATPPPADNYALIVGGMISCRRCAALLLDTRPAREQHDQFHTALRCLWDATGARS